MANSSLSAVYQLCGLLLLCQTPAAMRCACSLVTCPYVKCTVLRSALHEVAYIYETQHLYILEVTSDLLMKDSL